MKRPGVAVVMTAAPGTLPRVRYNSRMASARGATDRLKLFVDRVDRTAGRRAIVDQTVRAHFSLRSDAEAGASTFTTDAGDEEDLRSLLLDFRSFLSPTEDVFANRIFNILEQTLLDEELKQANRQNREAWKLACHGYISVVVNEKVYTAEQCFDLIVNGDLFHMDEQKAAEFSSLPLVMRSMMSQQMISLVLNGLQALWSTRNIAAIALEDAHDSSDIPADG